MAKTDTTYERLISDPKRRQQIEEEEFILKLTEKLCEMMKEQGITRSQLAEKLGTSRAFISQLLNGGRNMTLRTLFRLSRSLDSDVNFYFRKESADSETKGTVIHSVISRALPQVHYKEQESSQFEKLDKLAG